MVVYMNIYASQAHAHATLATPLHTGPGYGTHAPARAKHALLHVHALRLFSGTTTRNLSSKN
jgi:hypothetical protein